jgi:hypothetical protein
MPEGYFDFLEEDGLFDDSRLNSPVYVQFLMNYLSYYQQHVGATMSADMSLNQFNYSLPRKRFRVLRGIHPGSVP